MNRYPDILLVSWVSLIVVDDGATVTVTTTVAIPPQTLCTSVFKKGGHLGCLGWSVLGGLCDTMMTTTSDDDDDGASK